MHPGGFFSAYPFRHYDKSSIGGMVVAGGEHQQLVPVFGCNTGIVKRGGFDLAHILADHRLVGDVEVFVVLGFNAR